MREKENVVKQNSILREKLRQSEDLIEKLIGNAGSELQEEKAEEGEE